MSQQNQGVKVPDYVKKTLDILDEEGSISTTKIVADCSADLIWLIENGIARYDDSGGRLVPIST